MKRILICLASAALFVLVGHVLNSGAAAEALEAGASETKVSEGSIPKSQAPYQGIRLAGRDEAIAGTWYSYPVGTMVRFNGDGTADFGLDTSGRAIGYHARTWFEGERLFIAFTNYDGESDGCETAVGGYEVQFLEHNGVAFRPISDACRFRLDVLSGHPELGFDLVFHPVQM